MSRVHQIVVTQDMTNKDPDTSKSHARVSGVAIISYASTKIPKRSSTVRVLEFG